MESSTLPVFDFVTPWVGIIQLGLFFLNPQLVGHLTDRFTDPKVKIYVLGGLSLLGAVLTKLLDVAVADDWANLNSSVLLGVVSSFIGSWALSQFAFEKVLKPTGASAAAQESKVIQLFKADPERLAEANKAA